MPLSQALYIIHLIKDNGVIVGVKTNSPMWCDKYMLKSFSKRVLQSGENVAGIDLE